MGLRQFCNRFRRVPWSSALRVEDYQRLRLRLLTLYLVIGGLSMLATITYVVGTRVVMAPVWANTLFGAFIVLAALIIATGLVLIVQNIKLDLARLHDFNVPTCRALGILLAAVLSVVALGLADRKHGTDLLLWAGLAWNVAYALYTYYLFFVEAPKPAAYTRTAPFSAAPNRTENALLFLFQIGIWFNLLFAPLSYGIQNY